MTSTDPVGLLDVVCGKGAVLGSPHRYVHGGALFCFCSDECLARFIVDPAQFVATGTGTPGPATFRWSRRVRRAPGEERGMQDGMQAVPVATGSAAPDPLQPALPWAAPRATPLRGQPIAEIPSRRPATLRPEPLPLTLPAEGDSNLVVSLFAWREKRFAVRICKELLRLYRIVSAREPLLSGRPLYHEIVAAFNGGDHAHAAAVLTSAEQSFAIWPVERPLRFADVVHYLAVSEFLANHKGGRWIHASIKRIVAARVPHVL